MFMQFAHLLRALLKIGRLCIFSVYLFVILWLLFVSSLLYLTVALGFNNFSSGRKGNHSTRPQKPPPIALKKYNHQLSDTTSSRETALCKEMPRPLSLQQLKPANIENTSTADMVMEYTQQRRMTTFDTLGQEQPHGTSWQKYEMPQELQHVDATSQEIRTIVRDSTSHFQAIKASLEENVIEQQTFTWEPTVTIGEPAPHIVSSVAQHIRTDSSNSATSQESSALGCQSGVKRPSINVVTIDTPLAALPKIPFATSRCPGPRSPYDKSMPSQVVPSIDVGRQPRRHRFTRIFRRKVGNEKAASKIIPTEKTIDDQASIADDVDVDVECISCFDEIPKEDAVSLACQHPYCSPCFSKLVSTATQNENLFPPKCCLQEVPRQTIQAFLPSSEYDQFMLKAQEYTIPAADRWFCPSVQCGKWFDKSTRPLERDIVSCPFCKVKICQSCRGLSHIRGKGCPQDQGLDATIETAELNGWRRCYNCHAMVERDKGCQHITCRCTAEFW